MSRSAYGHTGCLGKGVILIACAAVAGTLWFVHKLRLERLLTNLGGEVTYAPPAGPLSRSERVTTTGDSGVARDAPDFIDRLFGRLVSVDFGRTSDLSDISPAQIVAAVNEVGTIQIMMLDGVPVTDADLLMFVDVPSMMELGLKGTKVTALGVAVAKKRRPSLEITWLDGP